MFEEGHPFYKLKNNIKKIYIDNLIITSEDETCLHSLGIKQDFICKIE